MYWCVISVQIMIKWATGQIKSQSGPVSYQVETAGLTWRRHVDHIVRGQSLDQQMPLQPSSEVQYHLPTSDSAQPVSKETVEQPPAPPAVVQPDTQPLDHVPRRSSRLTKPTARLIENMD